MRSYVLSFVNRFLSTRQSSAWPNAWPQPVPPPKLPWCRGDGEAKEQWPATQRRSPQALPSTGFDRRELHASHSAFSPHWLLASTRRRTDRAADFPPFVYRDRVSYSQALTYFHLLWHWAFRLCRRHERSVSRSSPNSPVFTTRRLRTRYTSWTVPAGPAQRQTRAPKSCRGQTLIMHTAQVCSPQTP